MSHSSCEKKLADYRWHAYECGNHSAGYGVSVLIIRPEVTAAMVVYAKILGREHPRFILSLRDCIIYHPTYDLRFAPTPLVSSIEK